jgi:hypothetical protein
MMNMKIQIFTALLFLALVQFACSSHINKVASEISGVKNPVLSLNGTWQITLEPPQKYWLNETDFSAWEEISMPGECQMQGFPIKHDQPFVFKKRFRVPDDFSGKHISLWFYGVYSYARVWVNGQFIREHTGGFTKWECNITDVVTPGEEALLTVEVTDRIDDISYASGYAKHQIGGILRDVELTALPHQHFKNLWYETHLDEGYKNATLKFMYEMAGNTSCIMKLEIFDPNQKRINQKEFKIENKNGELMIPVENPVLWDAEHPFLYTAVLSLYIDGKKTMYKQQSIGFREVAVEENKLLVNGRQVKLRGANRHDIHPTLGRTTTAEYDLQDVLLAKEANMNFIRTSHYPPSESFLRYCDQYGIYVEDETAVCFVGSHRMNAYRASGASQNDTLFTPVYLSQLEEMVNSHRNHPSVIIWSIGNENVFGENFFHSYDWVKKNDPTRPIIYSYPGQVPDSVQIYEILSMHYPNWKGNLNQYGISVNGFSYEKMPVLFDEWAHVACYNNEEIKKDPNVRNFWGQSLDSMWTYTFEADGGLGGAIWCFIDETFMLPKDLPGFNQWWGIIDPAIIPSTYVGPTVGYGEWGIVDTWRRKKPEFWNTKKAYSPAKIYQNKIADFTSGETLIIPVHNRFDQTNFNELKITWSYGNNTGTIENCNLEPHAKGEIVIPAQPWESGEKLFLSFFQNDTFLIDTYALQLGSTDLELPTPARGGKLIATESGDHTLILGENMLWRFNKKHGLIESVEVKGKTILESGPYINLKIPGKSRYTSQEILDYAKNWKCTGFNYKIDDGLANVEISGIYDSVGVHFNVQFDAAGTCIIDYRIASVPPGKIIQEAGIVLNTTSDFTELSWNREPYFTGLPENHLGSRKGKVDLTEKYQFAYREKPGQDWEMDRQNFYYHGLDTVLTFSNMARSTKENILTYSLNHVENSGLTIHSDGSQAARFDCIDGVNRLFVNSKWDYPSLGWGNYMKLLETKSEESGKVFIQFNF